MARPLEGVTAESEVLSLYIPRDLFGVTAENLDRLPDRIPDVGMAQVLADYLVTLEGRVPLLSPDDLPHLVEVTRAMIVACLAPTRDRLESAEKAITTSRLRRVRDIVRTNLRSPDLRPELICRQLGVSRSQLYRLFEPFGGVARYIHLQRLRAAHAALTDTENSQQVRQIAEEFAFTDASGFSRAFKQQFGYTPSDARRAVCAGIPRPPAVGRALMSDLTDLGDLLRRLHS